MISAFHKGFISAKIFVKISGFKVCCLYSVNIIKHFMHICGHYYMGIVVTKAVFEGVRTTKVQTSLRICTVRSAPLLFAFWKVSYLNLLQANLHFSSQSLLFMRSLMRPGLSPALSKTLKIGFLVKQPTSIMAKLKKNTTKVAPHHARLFQNFTI